MEINLSELWKSALAEIELSIGRASFVTWFKETAITDIADGTAIVTVPNSFAQTWLKNKYNKFILRAVRNINSDIRDVNFVIGKTSVSTPLISKELSKSNTLLRRKPQEPTRNPILSSEFELKDFNVNPETNLNPKYAFDNFVVGPFNELAHAAAEAVVKNLGQVYNPLFIYGGVGLGKTHLIQAIGNEFIKQNSAGIKVKYVTSEKFMGEVVEALRNQTIGQLKEKYRNYDVLIVDDVQFFGKTEKIQEEFFHTFNSLYERNKQIVLSSDRPPVAISMLEDRLKSRFEGGMIADIGEPDYETKLAILRVKSEKSGVSISPEILEYVAKTIKNNIRELEGALNRIVLTSKMTDRAPILEDVKKLMEQVIFSPRKFSTPKKVIKAVSDFYELSEKEMLNKSRKKGVVKPRQIAMYLLREELKCSFPFIGEKLGKKDHTTAIHAYKKIHEDLKTNLNLEEEIKLIKEKIYTP